MLKKSLIISSIVILFDQVIKILINNYLVSDINVIQNFFVITKVHNTGAAFSIFTDQRILLIIVSLLMLIIILKLHKDYKNNLRNMIAFGLVIGGLIGNLIDRIILGYVVDYLSFSFGSYNYPVFNLADTAIVIGIFLLLIATIKKEDRNENSSR